LISRFRQLLSKRFNPATGGGVRNPLQAADLPETDATAIQFYHLPTLLLASLGTSLYKMVMTILAFKTLLITNEAAFNAVLTPATQAFHGSPSLWGEYDYLSIRLFHSQKKKVSGKI